MPIDLNEAVKAYITCALFTADEDIVTPHSGEFDPSPYWSRIPQSVWDWARKVCQKFIAENAADLVDYASDDFGHDLWYTQNGHGVGFWEADHCTEEQGERLTAAAHKLGEKNVFKQRGWFYIE